MPDRFQDTIDLIQRVKLGDKPALEELFSRYLERVHSIARVRLGRDLRRFVDSTDVVQGVMLKALTRIGTFEQRDEGSFLNWLGKLCTNHLGDLLDHHRAKKRDLRRDVEIDAGAGDSSSAPRGDLAFTTRTPSRDAAQNEQQNRLELALDMLEDAHRELILMREYEGMEWDAIGAALGVKPDAARMRHKTAQVALASALLDLGERGGATSA